MMLCTNQEYSEAALKQSTFNLPLGNARGNIFDCNFKQITNTAAVDYALISPGGENYRKAFASVPSEQRSLLYSGTKRMEPFLVPVTNNVFNAKYIYRSYERYAPLAIAPHLIGYTDRDNKGCAGIEYAFDSFLQNASTTKEVLGNTSAAGTVLDGAPPVEIDTKGSGNGVMLTLDLRIQRICEGIAEECVNKGSIVVMDCDTGRVRASVSMPRFNPSAPEKSLDALDAPFINRSISRFNLGSVFKPLIAATALENGVEANAVYHCTGAIDVNGHVYKCAYGKGHGDVDMRKALEISCNCYFVDLGLRLGGDIIHDTAKAAGFGEATHVANGMATAQGNLPSKQTLADLGQLAAISFGQGELLCTPLQVAAFMNLFANGGKYIEPSFVEGEVNEYLRCVTRSLYAPQQRTVLSEYTSEVMRDMLVNVVQNGLGKAAMPREGGAGGKTGTAQTGRMAQDGKELMDAWFAGFYPANNPQYIIVVLLDEGTHESEEACKIFAKVANTISLCQNIAE
ncbi:MAG: penicillin-binding protein 2 [Oscillospiraceae bacterium]